MNRVFSLGKRGKVFWGVTGFILIVLLGAVDYFTGYQATISLFYLIPIALVSWYAGGRLGLFCSAAAAVALFIADIAGGLNYSTMSIYVWNTLLLVGFYFIVAWLISTLRKSYNLNLQLARLDYVTGAISVRYFYDLARMEMERSARYERPFTFAYIDMDNFKAINDRLGHSTGDRVLRAMAESIQRQIRPSDIFARLGGDEFALLMPETNEEEARNVITRLHESLVNEMLKYGWVITFSVGVVICNRSPNSVDEVVKMADTAMYSVKNTSKNGVAYHLYAG